MTALLEATWEALRDGGWVIPVVVFGTVIWAIWFVRRARQSGRPRRFE